MMDNGWRARLRAVIAERVKDKRENYTSLARKGGKGTNFVEQYVNTDRAPSLENLLVLGKILDVSPIYILLGFEITPEEEEFLRLVSRLSPSGREYLLATGRQMKALEDQAQPGAIPASHPSASD